VGGVPQSVVCHFWRRGGCGGQPEARARAGQVEAATATFERAVVAINDVGLLAEEVDPASGEMIENFPQAYSHIGWINAAWANTQAERLTSG
jgi:alpha,alpha-trehalase